MKQKQEDHQRKMREEIIRQENARKVITEIMTKYFTNACIIQAEEQRKKMEKDAELLKKKLFEEQKWREEV